MTHIYIFTILFIFEVSERKRGKGVREKEIAVIKTIKKYNF